MKEVSSSSSGELDRRFRHLSLFPICVTPVSRTCSTVININSSVVSGKPYPYAVIGTTNFNSCRNTQKVRCCLFVCLYRHQYHYHYATAPYVEYY